ncbi:hypothetical protein N0V82_004096 [Gnomoniopsis sp. IMI 355080]|nr:hypothetical protein N0V82_004096 [Gnomoniopsis sp. IMI 355080]
MDSQDYFDLCAAEIILRIGELVDCSPHAHTCKREPTPHVIQKFRGEWKTRPVSFGSGCKIADLASLASTCKRHHSLINPLLHRRELDDYRAFGLFWAAKHGRLDTLDNFLKYGGLQYINFTTFAGPIFSSDVCYKTDYLVLRLFPPQGDDIDFWGKWDTWWIRDQWRPHLYDWKFSLLALATMGGHDEVVTRLLDCGADIHAPSNTLCACEKLASYNSRASHAPMTTADNYYLGWAPIHYAVCHGHLSTTKLLLARGARHDRELVGTTWPSSYSTLYTAALKCNLPILDYLLEAGVAADQAFTEGAALHFALLCMGLASVSTVRRLLDSGVETDNEPPARSATAELFPFAGNLDATSLLRSVVTATWNSQRLYQEVSERDLISAVQTMFEDLLLSRPLPFYPEYLAWKRQQPIVLQRLRQLNEQIDSLTKDQRGTEISMKD